MKIKVSKQCRENISLLNSMLFGYRALRLKKKYKVYDKKSYSKCFKALNDVLSVCRETTVPITSSRLFNLIEDVADEVNNLMYILDEYPSDCDTIAKTFITELTAKLRDTAKTHTFYSVGVVLSGTLAKYENTDLIGFEIEDFIDGFIKGVNSNDC